MDTFQLLQLAENRFDFRSNVNAAKGGTAIRVISH
jgi:hypothetical protein